MSESFQVDQVDTMRWRDAAAWARSFRSDSVQNTLRAYGRSGIDPLTLANTLSKQFTQTERIHLMEWISLAEKIRHKFDSEPYLLCDRLAYEQSTGKKLSSWKSHLWPADAVIADLCCGMGGDSFFLSDKNTAIGVDCDPFRVQMYNTNCHILGKRHHAIIGNALDINTKCAYAQIDPARRNERNQNQRKLELAPSWDQILSIVSMYKSVMVKLPPAFPDELVPDDSQQLFLGSSKDCLEILLLLGDWDHLTFRENCSAVHTDTGDCYQADRREIPDYLPIGTGSIIWEPTPVMIRSHLYRHWGKKHNLSQLDPSVAYLTGDHELSDVWAQGYRVIDKCTMNQSSVRTMLKTHDIGNLTIKKRGVDIDPDQEWRKLKAKGENTGTLIYTPVNGRNSVFLTVPLSR